MTSVTLPVSRRPGLTRRPRLGRIALAVVLLLSLGGIGALLLGAEAPETASRAPVAGEPTAAPADTGAVAAMPDATPLASGIVRDVLMVSGYTDEGIAYDLLLAPPVFFESVRRPDHIEVTGADRYVVFLIAEHHVHESASHPDHFGLMPILRIDGKGVHVARTKVELSNGGHHRTTALVFEELPAALLEGEHVWEMIMPEDAGGDRAVHVWQTPIEFPEGETIG